MINRKQLNTTFFITAGISVVVFIYLVFLGYDEIKTFKDVIKIIFSILFPIPMLLFVRSILIDNFIPENSDEYKKKNQKPATLLLAVSLILMLLLLQLMELAIGELEDHLIIAHLLNSTIISSYVLNYIVYNNLKVKGALSGILMALAIHVFF
ncbi:hypothetical protein Q2T40_06070 [Winogradskyella maritima]|uniref:CAAX prenyl protease-like protein n=1 Tax=Winogradskyella maritima TaxID=1517766 RepID=A0ABV8AJW2_9FLAO|nr:hypothetical protein [Winogradskyella maritima]